MKAARYCSCSVPERQVDEGVAYCKACGERIADPRDEVLVAVARALVRLEHKVGQEHPARNGAMVAVPRTSLTRAEAAQSLGVSVDFLDKHVLPELKVIRRGRLILIQVSELERWLKDEAATTLPRGGR